jgi:PAS domain S-box-containing protein
VLVAEDDPLVADVIRSGLEDAGCTVAAIVDDGMAAIEASVVLQPDLILMDVRLKGEIDGIQAVELIHRRTNAPVVYLTGSSDQVTLQRAKASSAFGFVLKPFRIDSLLAVVEVAIARFRMEQHLEQRQITYATILDSISDGIITTDTDGRVRFMNSVAERLTGLPIGEAQGTPATGLLRFAGTASGPDQDHPVSRALKEQQRTTIGPDEQVVSRAGSQVPVDGGVGPVIDRLGRLLGATITLRDVTAERNAAAELHAMAERLRVVVETAADGVLLLDASGTILMFNAACVRLFGLPPEEIVGGDVEQLLHAPLTDDYGRPLATSRPEDRAGVVVHARATRGRRKDGSTFPAELSVGEAFYDGRSVFACVIHDTSERERIDAAVVAAIDSERRRFVYDLHEGVAQDIAGLSLLLASLSRSAQAEEFSRAADLQQAADLAAQAIASCREIARGLSPVDDDHGGLIAGLRALVSRVQQSPGQRIELEAPESAIPRLPRATANHLYRIAEEALTNARIHANARSIKLAVQIDGATVRLLVCDDGHGLQPPDYVDRRLGLSTMRYRASAIGANLTIGPQPGGGTCIECVCPQAPP